MKKSKTGYHEGQWFLVPLFNGGYALGVIVRGDSTTHGGLGYFFGPKLVEIPDETIIWSKKAEDAIFIGWFSDIGIKKGEWLLIPSSKLFSRKDWPVPVFRKIDLINPERCYKVIYDQDVAGSGEKKTYSMERAKPEEIKNLLDDGVYGYKALQIVLTELLR